MSPFYLYITSLLLKINPRIVIQDLSAGSLSVKSPPARFLSLPLKIPSTFNASQAMAFDGCFHDNDIELTTFPRLAPTLTSDPLTSPTQSSDMRPTEGTRLRRQRSVRENVDLLVNNSYMIDSYSRLAFPLSYLLFNTIYWSMYS